jgi:hypothetical protein
LEAWGVLCNQSYELKLMRCVSVQENVGVREKDAGDCETTYLALYGTEPSFCLPHYHTPLFYAYLYHGSSFQCIVQAFLT